MTESQITFNSEMISAIRKGIKTCTRRPVKFELNGRVREPDSNRNWHIDDANVIAACPYGGIADRISVRGTDIKLEITCVQIQRLQEISEGEAIAEGWPKAAGDFDSPAPGNGGPFDWFRSGWSDIYGPDSWDKNPYVWAITFRRLND